MKLIRLKIATQILFVLIAVTVFLTNTLPAQAQPYLQYYHPTYSDGKWQNDTVVCYVIPYRLSNNEDLALKVFTKAAQAWNDVFQGKLYVKIVSTSLQDTSEVGQSLSRKNLLSFGNRIIKPAELVYGRTLTLLQDTIKTGYDTLYVRKTTHIEMNLRFWERGLLVLGAGDPLMSALNVYAVAAHEFGHLLLGIDNNHEVPSQSVIAASSDYDFTDYDQTSLVLGNFDKLLFKTVYSTIAPNHTQDPCLPRR